MRLWRLSYTSRPQPPDKMKKMIVAWFWLGILFNCAAQGTFEFTASLSDNIDASGTGTFSLTSNILQYDLRTSFPMSQAQIRSPWPDPTAPVIFDLDLRFCDPPPCPSVGCYCYFHGGFKLSDSQATDLTSGQWYVYAPNGPFYIQGQILPVPEPHPIALLAFAGSIYSLFRWYRKTTIKPRLERTPQNFGSAPSHE